MKKILFALTSLFFACGFGNEKPLGPYPPPELGPYAIQGLIRPTQNNMQPQENATTAQESAGPSRPEAEISGIVRLDPKLAATLVAGPKILFLIARPQQGGPPLAVKRMVVEKFPVAFSLANTDTMTPGRVIEGKFLLLARLDADGSAGPAQSGDLEGSLPQAVSLGQSKIEITISKRY